MSNAIKSNVLAKGIALGVPTFISMIALGYYGASELATLGIQTPYTLEKLVSFGTIAVVALALPMIRAGLKGSVKNTVALGSLPSFVLGLLVFMVV